MSRSSHPIGHGRTEDGRSLKRRSFLLSKEPSKIETYSDLYGPHGMPLGMVLKSRRCNEWRMRLR